jgi:cell division protein FtsQ
MSETSLFFGEPERRTAAAPDHGGRPPLRPYLWTIIILLVCLAVFQLLFALVISPRVPIDHIEVEANFPITESQIRSIAGIGDRAYYFSMDTAALQARLAEHPPVKSAVVEKIFPDRLRIVLKKRTPLALAFGRTGNKSVPVAVDEEGVVFQIGPSISDWGLPVLSGLVFKPLQGLKLPRKLLPLLTELESLRDSSPGLFSLVSEIEVVSVNAVDYELLFYPMGYNVRVNMGDRFDEKMLKYTLLVLNVLKQQGVTEKVRELDFRTGEVVYRLDEEEG